MQKCPPFTSGIGAVYTKYSVTTDGLCKHMIGITRRKRDGGRSEKVENKIDWVAKRDRWLRRETGETGGGPGGVVRWVAYESSNR
jgi:hypothetical protein